MEHPSFLLLLVLAASVFSVRSQCPSAEDIFPCKCKVDFISEDMTLECDKSSMTLNELKSVLSYFSKEDEIYLIELKHLNLGTIPSNFFEGFAVKRMNIYNCVVEFENGKPPLKGLEDSLQHLTITYSLTQKNSPLYLKLGHLEELETLTLSHNKISELPNDMFDDKMQNLHSIVLQGNLIEIIGRRSFENLTNIKYFALQGNKLGLLRRHMVPSSAAKLTELRLSNNGLKDLADDFFTSMPSLEEIYLHENRLKDLDRYTWKDIINQLRWIGLMDNPIQCDSGMGWIIKTYVNPYIFLGECAGPSKEKGMKIYDFIDKGRQ